MEKPTTVLISDLKDNLAKVLNECNLPAWVILYALEPFVNQLNMLKELQENEDKKAYEDSLKDEENSVNSEEENVD